jgi:hypothetical protein
LPIAAGEGREDLLLQRQRSDLDDSPIGSAARRTAVIPNYIDPAPRLIAPRGLRVNHCGHPSDLDERSSDPVGRSFALAQLALKTAPI